MLGSHQATPKRPPATHGVVANIVVYSCARRCRRCSLQVHVGSIALDTLPAHAVHMLRISIVWGDPTPPTRTEL